MQEYKRQYLPSRIVCARYNICARTLYRWREAPDLKFPKGLEIKGRRYFSNCDLDEWDRGRSKTETLAAKVSSDKYSSK